MRVPTTEIVLDQHTIHNHLDEAYIDTSSSGAFEAKWNQGQVKGIELLNSELGGEDLIDAGRGNDFAVGGEGKDTLIANAGTSDVMIGGNGDMVIASQNYSSSDEYLNDLLQVLDLLSENDQTVLTGFAENDFNSLPSLGSVLDGLGNDDNGGNTGDGVYDISYGAQTLTLSAGESAEIVSYVWPGNPWWTPNIILTVNGDSAPELLWEWDNVTGAPSSVQTAAGHYFIVDIPDAPNEENRYVIRVVAMTAGTFTIAMGNQ
jgi:hypothetical protein